MTTDSFEIQPFIDRQPIRRIHITVIALCTAAMFFDGFDIFVVGKIAPAIAKGFGQSVQAMTMVFIAQQVGLAVGAFVATPLADRFGRRRLLVAAIMAFSVLTLCCVFVQSLAQLAVFRALSGVALAGVLPMALALVTEVTPARRRAVAIAISVTGFSAGSAAGGIVAAVLLDRYGWQSAFWIGGLAPLILVPAILLLVPESLQFLASRDARHPQIARTLRRFDPDVSINPDQGFSAGDGSAKAGKARLLDIFRDGRARTTTILFSCFFLSMGNVALLAAWLPTFFQEMAGIPIQRFALTFLIGVIGGLTGTLTIGWLMDRIAPLLLIRTYFIGLAVMLVVLAFVPFGSWMFAPALMAWSFFQAGGQVGLNTLTAQYYPASARSTGIGWAGGVGRLGGIVAPLFGGFALAQHLTLEQTLMLVALPPVGVFLLLVLLGRRPMSASPAGQAG